MTAADENPVNAAADLPRSKARWKALKPVLLAWGIGLIIAAPLIVVIDQKCVWVAGPIIFVTGQFYELPNGKFIAMAARDGWNNVPSDGIVRGDFTLTVMGQRSGLRFWPLPDTRYYSKPVTSVRISQGSPATAKRSTFTATTLPRDSPAAAALDEWFRTRATADECAAWQGTLNLVDRGFGRMMLGWFLLAMGIHLLALWYVSAMQLRAYLTRRRRAKLGQCLECGYSLVGLPAPRTCPECGTKG